MSRSSMKAKPKPPKSAYAGKAFFAGLRGERTDWSLWKHFAHIPMPWLLVAVAAGTSALRVALLLWYFHGLHTRIPRLSYAKLSKLLPLGLTARNLASGVTALRKAGLISVSQKPGGTCLITVLDDEELLHDLERNFWIAHRRGSPRARLAKQTARKIPEHDIGGDSWEP